MERNHLPVDVALGDLGPADGQSQHQVEAVGDVRVQTARQVPRFHDPIVGQRSVQRYIIESAGKTRNRRRGMGHCKIKNEITN